MQMCPSVPHRLAHLRRRRPYLRTTTEKLIRRFPVDVGEEGFDVLAPLGRFVVEQKGVLPDVHDEDRLEPGRNSNVVQFDPVV